VNNLPRSILLVEDNPMDVDLAFSQQNQIELDWCVLNAWAILTP